jgi:Glu-tRNA(Gln) amidotransferase subunit E-like FAD-binding protein
MGITMGKRKSSGSSKNSKSKKHKEKSSRDNIYKKEEENSKKVADEVYNETVIQESEANDASDLQADASASKTSSDTVSETTNNINTNTDIADCCEEIKAKQEELFNRLKNLSESLVAITLIRDDVNSLRVDTLTELYFTRQVRPLLDALNIISFASTNISAAATSIQTSAFGDTKEIKNALKLSYKMNDEVDDIIDALGRRLTIFLKEINNMDKNCPPFYSGKDS